MKKVSIIIPVYNVEKYLKQCIDSILQQTYENLEIILIDDESQDNCPQICDSYALEDQRIKVIHKKNGGAGSARNAGINICSGEYICFVDSDDYVEATYIEDLVNKLIEFDADIASCSYYDVYKNKIEESKFEFNIFEFTNVEFLERFLSDWRCGLLWNKIFKRDVIANIKFVEGRKIDDEFFTYKCVINSKKVILFNKSLIYYRQRKSGVMQNNENSQIILKDRLDYLTERYDQISIIFPKLKNNYLKNLMDNFIILKRQITLPSLKQYFISLTKKYHKEILGSSLSVKEKLLFFLNLYLVKKEEIYDTSSNVYFD